MKLKKIIGMEIEMRSTRYGQPFAIATIFN